MNKNSLTVPPCLPSTSHFTFISPYVFNMVPLAFFAPFSFLVVMQGKAGGRGGFFIGGMIAYYWVQ